MKDPNNDYSYDIYHNHFLTLLQVRKPQVTELEQAAGVGEQPAINAVSAGIEKISVSIRTTRFADLLVRDRTVMTVSIANGSIDPKQVPLGTGPPTRDELLTHYPAQFTWTELKTFINAGYGPEIW